MRGLAMLMVPVMVLSVGCAARRHAVATDARPAPQTPQDCDRLFAERLSAGDLDGVVALYEPTATLMKQDGTPAVGTAAIRQELAAVVALKPTLTMNVFRVLSSGDVAVMYNDWQAAGTDANGKHVELKGRASEVVHRQPDGTWRFAIDDPDARTMKCERACGRDRKKRSPHDGKRHGHRKAGRQ